MPIDSLYADDTRNYLAGQNALNLPAPPQPGPNTSITSIARAVGRGVGQGSAALFGAGADTFSGLSQVYSDPDTGLFNPQAQADDDKRINEAIAKGKAGTLFQSSIGTNAYNFSDSLKPDPASTTAIDQTVQSVSSALTQLVPATLAAGPAGGALIGGTSIGMGRAEDLKRQGVDVGTRTKVGAVAGVAGGVGALLPVAGSSLASTVGLVAAGGPGLSILQSATEKAILKNAGYNHLSDPIDPLDPLNLAASTMVAGVMAGVHVGGQKLAARRDQTATPSTDIAAPVGSESLDQMSLAQRKALPYNSPILDAHATQAAQAAGVPPQVMMFVKNEGERSNSDQVSSAGAKGIMQFMPKTWSQYGTGDITDPVQSINAGANYLADLGARYHGDWRAALAEYNGGVEQAKTVQAGGAPTKAETADYLNRFDHFSAEHQISNTPFTPTADQVDAALGAHSQRIVADAHIFGEPDDIGGMSQNQNAFELAARQMDSGDVPDVTNLIPETEFGRARGLDSLISDAENFRSDLAARADNIAEPGAIANIRDQIDQLTAARPDDSPQGIKAAAKALQDSDRLSYKQALSRAQKETAAALEDHQAQLTRLHQLVDQNADAQQARQHLDVLDSHLADMRAARAQIDAPYTRPTRVVEALRGIDRSRVESVPRERAVDVPSEAVPGAEARAPGTQPGAAVPENVPGAQASGEGATPSAVESNLRQLAGEDTTTNVHLDATSGPHEGTIADMMRIIDEEHAASTQDADLLTVAANCFIS